MKLIIDYQTYLKIKYTCNGVEAEVSGMGKTEYKEGNIYLTDFLLFEQFCTGATTNLDNNDMAKVLFELQKRDESTENWNAWIHTHYNFNVFWSGIDDDTISENIQSIPHLVSLVVNQKDEMLARLDFINTDTKFNLKGTFSQELDIEILLPDRKKIDDINDEILKLELELEALLEDTELKKQIDEEIKKKVSISGFKSKNWKNKGNWWDKDDDTNMGFKNKKNINDNKNTKRLTDGKTNGKNTKKLTDNDWEDYIKKLEDTYKQY